MTSSGGKRGEGRGWREEGNGDAKEKGEEKMEKENNGEGMTEGKGKRGM